MAIETWDEIQAGWQPEKSERKQRAWRVILFLPVFAMVCYTSYDSGARHERKQAAAANWDVNRKTLWWDYYRLGTAASKNDAHSYLLLLPSVWQTTGELERDLLDMGEWKNPAKREVVQAAHRCMPYNMEKFNGSTPDERNACNTSLQPPR